MTELQGKQIIDLLTAIDMTLYSFQQDFVLYILMVMFIIGILVFWGGKK